MLKDEIERRTTEGRAFMRFMRAEPLQSDEPYQTDQEQKLPQPPLVKARMRPEEAPIALPQDFTGLAQGLDLTQIIRRRKSSRVYTQQGMTLQQLSYLLWATQGVRGVRGKSYATLRTVPSGGARHPFETYLLVQQVDGLVPGAYHYLPMEHQLEFLGPVEDLRANITASLAQQSWAAKADVVFYWSCVPYRAEWRYGIMAHRIVMVDAGHMGQNLYMACAGLGLGTCGIGAFDDDLCGELFGLDDADEFIVYTAPVGTISDKNAAEEAAFYTFVEEDGL